MNFKEFLNKITDLKKNLTAVKENANGKIHYSANKGLQEIDKILEYAVSYNQKQNQFINPSIYFSSIAIKSLSNIDNNYTKNFVNELVEYINENKYTYAVTNTYMSLAENRYNTYFSECVNDIEKLLEHDETFIKNNISVYLNKHAWIGQVKPLLEEYSNRTNKFTSTQKVNVYEVYSPVYVEADRKAVFYMDNKYYRTNGTIFENVDKLSSLNINFIKMCSVLENYKFTENSLTLYRGLNELNLKIDEHEIVVNGIAINKLDYSTIKSAIYGSNFYKLSETSIVENLMYLLENFNSVKKIDIVTRLQDDKGNVVNIIKLDEKNIYLNRKNISLSTNEIIKVDTFTQAQNLVNEYFIYDISKDMKSIVKNEENLRNNLQETKLLYENRIEFLRNRIDKINSYKNDMSIKDFSSLENALNLLSEEKRNYELELNKIYKSISEL